MTGSRRSTLVAAALAACLVGCERPTPAAAPEGDALGPTPARQDSPVQEDSNTLRVGESVITVVLTGRVDEAPRAGLLAWVRRSAEAVAAYLGRFPVPEPEVTLDVGRGDSVGFGQHWDGRWIAVDVGARISRAGSSTTG